MIFHLTYAPVLSAILTIILYDELQNWDDRDVSEDFLPHYSNKKQAMTGQNWYHFSLQATLDMAILITAIFIPVVVNNVFIS